MTAVLLADDIELSGMLAEYPGEGFATAGKTASAARLAAGSAFQIVVLDVMMPRIDEIKGCAASAGEPGAEPSSHRPGRGVDRIIGLELGADDCVAPLHPARVMARLPRSAGMQPHADAGPLTISGLALWPGARRMAGPAGRAHQPEFNLSRWMARARGSKKDLSEQALGRPLARFERSVDVHLSSIRQKLGDAAALIRTVRGQGYHLARE
jgi:two-component system OmpR family response regulator